MLSDEGTTAEEYTGAGGTGSDPDNGDSREKRPPYSINQQFLVVNVPLKSTNEAIINAVTQALNDRQDIPFFQNRMGKKGIPSPYPEQQVRSFSAPVATDAAESPSDDRESLLILVNQEGYP